MDPITPTAAAVPIADRILRIERAEDGSITELEFTDDRGERAQVRIVDGTLVTKGLATLWPIYDREVEFGFVHSEQPATDEERALQVACARSPRGIEMLYVGARTLVEASVMAEATQRFEADAEGVLAYLLHRDGSPGGPWLTESAAELERGLGDIGGMIAPFPGAARFGNAAERVARSAWCEMIIVEVHEQQRIRRARADTKESGYPEPFRVH